MVVPRKKASGKAQQIVLPDEIVGKQGKLLGVVNNPDGSASMYFLYSNIEYSDETIDELRKAGASVNVFNRYNPLYTSFESYYSSVYSPYSTAIRIPTDPHERMKLCREICILEPVVGTAVEIMVDISYNGFKIDPTGDEKVDKFYQEFNEAVDMENVLSWIFQEYYYSGNVTVYRELDKNKIPIGYTVLNPFCVYVEGSLLMDSEIITVDLQEEFSRLSALPDELRKRLLQTLPSELKKYLDKGIMTRVPLPPEKVTRITRKKQPYERYATPMLTRLIFPVLFKHKLHLMDLSTIEGVINQLMVVTVGDKDHPVTDKTLKQVASLFLTPKKSFTVFWDWTLKVNIITPNAVETLYQDKYKQVNEDIAKGLGIPRVIIDGTGASYSTAFVGVQMLIERVSREIMAVKRWLESEYRRIAEIKGFSTYPRVRFDKTQLRQENYVRQILTPLYDRGLISAETIITEAGFNYKSEIERKKRAEEYSQYFIPPALPYTGKVMNPLKHEGREPGIPSEEYKERDIVDTPDNGPSNTLRDPAQASKSDYIERQIKLYKDVFTTVYDGLYDDLVDIYNNGEVSLEDKLQKVSLIFSAFKNTAFETTFPFIKKAANYIYGLSDKELLQLTYWHSGALEKFTQDIYSGVVQAFKDEDIEALQHVFEANRYRLELFATEGIMEGYRLAELKYFKDTGVDRVRWVAVMDERTCNICASRHGVIYPVSMVPQRPHARCRCHLEPV